MPEVIEDGVSGFVCDDVDEMVEAMCRGYVQVYEQLTRAASGGTHVPAQRQERVPIT